MHSSNLYWPGAFIEQSGMNDALCREVVLSALNHLESFLFLFWSLVCLRYQKVKLVPDPCHVCFPSQLDQIPSIDFFPLSVLWFCYLDKVLSLVFNFSSVGLSIVRQQTPYRGMDNTETYCLSIPWPKILALSYREKVKRDIWTNR